MTICLTSLASAAERPRLLVLTDIGGDPDDQQSMIRLLAYANEFEIEGLIASASGTPNELKEKITKPQIIREVVEAYGKVQPQLAKHAEGYPGAAELLGVVKSGNPIRGMEGIGEGKDTEGSRWIADALDKADARPLNIAIWGGQTDLAQALWSIRKIRGEAGLKQAYARMRVYDIADQDRIHPWIFENFGDAFYVLGNAPAGRDKREGVFRGMYLKGDESLTSAEWINANVKQGHGPLGALYPMKTYTAPNPHGVMKEGDTPSWFYFLANGLSDPAHPDWGGWGGRYRHDSRGLWRDAVDKVGNVSEARATVWRWRAAFQNDFAARMDWCVKAVGEANHAPVAVLNGDRTKTILRQKIKAGGSLSLSAAGSNDRDGNALQYRWWIYPEAGIGGAGATIASPGARETSVTLPATSSGATVHVILEVTDNGTPALTSYRRAVVETEK